MTHLCHSGNEMNDVILKRIIVCTIKHHELRNY